MVAAGDPAGAVDRQHRGREVPLVGAGGRTPGASRTLGRMRLLLLNQTLLDPPRHVSHGLLHYGFDLIQRHAVLVDPLFEKPRHLCLGLRDQPLPARRHRRLPGPHG